MKLSVIILNYNVRHFLELCLLSVEAALENSDSEIIVVDNNSPDDSCEMVKSRFPNVKLIENKENSGFPKGNNIGVACAKGEYICILNPDTVVAEDTFLKVLAFAEKQANLGIIGVKLIDGTGKFLPESKRGIPTPFTAFTKITGLYKISDFFGKYYAAHVSENQTGKVQILVGAFMVMKTELYNEIGGFDEDCFMYSDDIDLSYMVLKTGKSNYYFHETTVIHYKGESTIKDGTYMRRFREAMEFFYKKHFSPSFLFSWFMKSGIIFFSLLKMFQGKQRPKVQPQSYILISDKDQLRLKLQSQFKKSVAMHLFENEKEVFSQTFSKIQKQEIILDNNVVSFKDCISFLQKPGNSKFSFKIMPKNSDFIIGSNSSNDRGEVIKIE